MGTVSTEACKGSDTAGGLVGYMPSGVLLLSGQVTTEVNQYSNSANRGWILGKRGNTLVCSTSEWIPKGNGYNDIGNWGQVLQVQDKSKLDGLLTFDNQNHTVTVEDLESSMTIKSAKDFAAAALRLQLDSKGALIIPADIDFDDTVNLSLSGIIDLNNTGLTGFQRDYMDAEVADVTLEGTNNATFFYGISKIP